MTKPIESESSNDVSEVIAFHKNQIAIHQKALDKLRKSMPAVDLEKLIGPPTKDGEGRAFRPRLELNKECIFKGKTFLVAEWNRNAAPIYIPLGNSDYHIYDYILREKDTERYYAIGQYTNGNLSEIKEMEIDKPSITPAYRGGSLRKQAPID